VSISGSESASQYEYAIYYRYKGGWTVGGGTSASAPVWAALILLTDQYLEAHNRPSAGWIDPAVYQLGRSLQMLPPYHDVTEGDNLLYHATVGWDYASGWGSPYAWNFTLDLACLEGVCPEGATLPAPTATATARAAPTAGPAAHAAATSTPLAHLG
jgi:subtilase family serine protease